MAATLETTLIYEAFMRANLKKEEEKQLAQNTLKNGDKYSHHLLNCTFSTTREDFVNISKCERGEKNSTRWHSQ